MKKKRNQRMKTYRFFKDFLQKEERSFQGLGTDFVLSIKKRLAKILNTQDT